MWNGGALSRADDRRAESTVAVVVQILNYEMRKHVNSLWFGHSVIYGSQIGRKSKFIRNQTHVLFPRLVQ